MLLGQTLDGMRVWDVRRAVQALEQIPEVGGVSPTVVARGNMAGVALHASLFDPPIRGLYLAGLPRSHRDGPIFLNVLRYLDVQQVLGMAFERAVWRVVEEGASSWPFP